MQDVAHIYKVILKRFIYL